MKIRIPKGTEVCFNPSIGIKMTTVYDLVAEDAQWGVNGTPGYVFNYKDGQPTAYVLDYQKVEEILEKQPV